MKTMQQLAKEVLGMFVTDTRGNGSEFYKLHSSRPDWMQDLCRTAHGDMLPDDSRFKMIHEALVAIAHASEDADLDEVAFSLEGDVYTADLMRWISSHYSRAEYVNEAVNEGGGVGKGFDLVKALMQGQAAEKREVFSLVKNALDEYLDRTEMVLN